MAKRIVTLTTDFGTSETYVGQLKGALISANPDCLPLDLTHEVPVHDVRVGAFLLETAYSAFPEGTIHLAVVDPGVGTSRRALVVQTARHYFVAPDNGLLTRVLRREPSISARWIENPDLVGERDSATFEGRDRFAPAAALLAGGTPLERLGPPASSMVLLDFPIHELSPGRSVPVEVLHVDRFGNAILDLDEPTLRRSGTTPSVLTPAGTVDAFARTYAEISDRPFLLINSAGYLEIALTSAPAAERLGISPGDRLRVELA